MAAILVIAISGSTSSGATGSPLQPLELNPSQARESTASPRVAPVHCPSVQKSLRYYTKRWQYWAKMRGAATTPKPAADGRCPRYLLKIRKAKAGAAHRAYDRWQRDEYHWQRWLPRLWYAIGMCETGLDWHFDSGTYVSAFGIIRSAFPGWNGNNSPREQYRVALGIAGRYGLNAWGCYSHGGYRYHL